MAEPDIEVKLLRFAQDLGKVQGKVEQIDERVEHNCKRNEENFKTLDDKFDALNSTIITTMSTQNGRISANEKAIGEQVELSHKLHVAVAKRSIALWAIFIWLVLSFVFGRAYDWDWVKSYFHSTTTAERAEAVKQGVETISKVVK